MLIYYIAGEKISVKNETAFQSNEFEESQFYKEYLKSNDSIVFVNLWATWCGPCIAEIPLLNKIKSQYSSWPISFVSLSLEKDLGKVDRFLERKTFDFKDISRENINYRSQIYNFLNGRPMSTPTNKYSIPMTYLIKNKKVIKIFKGELDNKEIYEFIDQIILE